MKKLLFAGIFLLLILGQAVAAVDGAYTKTSPDYPTENTADAFGEIKENFAYIERAFFIEEILMLDGYYIDYTYTDGNITAMTVKDSGATTKGSAVVTYSDGNISAVAWTIDSKILTYTYTYSSGNISRVTLEITTP